MGSTSVGRSGAGREFATALGTGRTGLRLGLAGLAGLVALACLQAAPRDTEVEQTGLRAAEPAVEADPPLRVGTSGDYAPFSVWAPGDAEPRGFSVDIARAYAKARGRRIEWIRFRWPELDADLGAGRFELVLSGITIRPDRSLAGRFSLPLTTTGAVALVSDTSALRSGADLDRSVIRISVNRGGHLERVARSLFPRAVIESIADNEDVPNRLADGLADAIVTDLLEAPHWQARLPRTRAVGPLTRDLKAAWFPIEGEALARDFDEWLFRFEADGELAGLRERNGLSGVRTAIALPALLASLDERLALMPAVADAKRVLGVPVEDRSQEERVHGAVRLACQRAAAELGIEPPSDAALRRFVDAQLRAARFVQARVIAAAATGPASAPEIAAATPPGPPDHEAARRALDQRIRPALSFITDRIAWLIVAGAGSGDPPTREQVSRALARHGLPAGIEAEIQASLEALVTPPPSARRASPAPPARSAPRDITASG